MLIIPIAGLSYPRPIVRATPKEKPSKTELGITVQYFSSLRRYTRKERIPAPIAIHGIISIPFLMEKVCKMLQRAAAGPNTL